MSPWRPIAVVEQADQLLVAAQQRAETARRVVDELARREETQRLAARLTKIDAALRDRDGIAQELSTIAVTDDLLRQIEKAAAAVERAEGQLALVSATVEFVAATDIELVIGDQRVSLPAGQTWSTRRERRDRGRGSRHRDRTSHAGHVRARHSGAIRCGARDVGRCAGGGTGRRSGRGAAVPISDAANCRAPATSSPRRWPGCAATTTSSSCAPGWRNCAALPALSGDITIDAGAARAELDRGRSGPRQGERGLRDPPHASRRWQ